MTVSVINAKDNNKIVKVNGLIDSGADCCLINSGYASTLLNVDYKKGIHDRTEGVDNLPVDIYYHEVELEIDKIINSKNKIQIEFINSPAVGLLLDRDGFFDNFRIIFDMVNYCFEVDSYSDIFSPRKSDT